VRPSTPADKSSIKLDKCGYILGRRARTELVRSLSSKERQNRAVRRASRNYRPKSQGKPEAANA
jgi:hypothetical protein